VRAGRFIGPVFSVAAAIASPAYAGPSSEALRTCVVQAVKPLDRETLLLATFIQLAQHPVARPYATVTPAQLEASQRREAQLFERLLFTDCHD
jgi:hypothetical protein